MKNQNPLYVVQGSTVMEAKGLFDMFLKKFNLEPAFDALMSILRLLFAQVQNYPTFVFVKKMADDLIQKFLGLVGKFATA